MTGSTPNHRQRGITLILIAGLMLFLGQTLLKHLLFGRWYLLYWFCCLALAAWSMVSALREFRAIRRQLRQDQLDLFRHSFSNLADHQEVFARLEQTPAPEDKISPQQKV